MKNFFWAFIFYLVIFHGSVSVESAELTAELSADRNIVEVSGSLILGMIFKDTQTIPAPELPAPDGFRISYVGPSTVMSIVNGQMSSSVTHRYQLVAVKTGVFLVGPFSFSYQGNNYQTNSLEIKVVDQAQALSGAKQSRQLMLLPDDAAAEDDIEDKIFAVISAEKTEAYVNEIIPLKIKLFVRNLSVRDVQYPVVDGAGFIKEEFPAPRQYREQLGDKVYEVVDFSTNVYATKDGQITIGPARIKCNVIVKTKKKSRSSMEDIFDFDESFFGDMFSRVKVAPVELASKTRLLNVKMFPQEGVPADFRSAVGEFKLEADCEPKEVKAGDPITLRMKISGQGNFDSVQSPALEGAEEFKVYNPQSRQEGDTRIFEQVIIPQKEGITLAPKISFSFFSPRENKYITLSPEPLLIKVLAGDQGNLVIVDGQSARKGQSLTQVVGQDIIYIKDDLGQVREKGRFLWQKPWFWGVNFLPLLILALASAWHKQTKRLNADISYARKLKAPKIAAKGLKQAKIFLQTNKPKEFYDQIFKTLQQYLGHRFNLAANSISADILNALPGLIADNTVIEKLARCFQSCDMARYTSLAANSEKMKNILRELEEAIDYLERFKK